jgi:DMSO/TMAO reductase YedYZ molybdopterin-dependent catalytic subunit/thiosulfate reductase cytochrome b subunit
MEITHKTSPVQASQMTDLSIADDHVNPNTWMPPQTGIIPHVRIGQRWINILWVVPLILILLVPAVIIAQHLRTMPAVQAFIAHYPGDTSSRAVYSGFPLWLRILHFLNLFFMMFIIRAGIQILADHPRLYWNRNSTPGTEWFRFQHAVPQDRAWTSKDDSVSLPKWLGIPGIRHSVGLARWWHFSFDLLWVINGIIFYVLLFSSDQWQRVVPTDWSVFPNALSTALQYLSLRFPVDHTWTNYNGLQQLTYFITIFIAAPLAAATGLMQGPAFSNKLGWLAKIINRQVARTIHFLVLSWFLFFICVHVSLVFANGVRQNLNHMFAGVDNASWQGFWIFMFVLVIVATAWLLASPFTLKHSRLVQKIGHAFVNPIKIVAEQWEPNNQYTNQDISPYFWVNGTLPVSEEFRKLELDNFVNYRLIVGGLVTNPREFSYAELKAISKQEQITKHFCIQGWSGVAKWGGVPMRSILEIVKPAPDAHYVVFYSFAEGAEGGVYYDVHTIQNMRHRLSLLAYEMNGAPLNVPHGAPLRLRCENQLGFKMVKWIRAIEFVQDFAHLGNGQGGYNEDHEFYGNRMPI